MALAAATVFEVRGGSGSDTNGGGFVTGATGTDYSQQNSKNTVGSDISTTDAVANGTTTLTSATGNFGTTIVGNIIYLAGGSGSLTAGWYQVTARASTTSITLDRSVAAGTGITMNIGGAFNTIATAVALMSVSDMICYVKATATYSISVAITLNSGVSFQFNTRLVGYTTTRGDGGMPTIQTSAGVNGINFAGSNWSVENFILDGNNTGLKGAVINSGDGHVLFNCLVENWTLEGGTGGATPATFLGCDFFNNGGTNGQVSGDSNTWVVDCTVRSPRTSKKGIVGPGNIHRCLVYGNSVGIDTSGTFPTTVTNNTVYNNTSDGILFNSFAITSGVYNNILVNNGGYGINSSSTGADAPGFPQVRNNAFYNNTSGQYHNITSGGGDVTLSGVPFTNAAGADFSLNNTAGQGAACRAVGYPASFINGGNNYLDIGAFQHQDSGGATTNLFVIAE